jgi:hypothetical protein
MVKKATPQEGKSKKAIAFSVMATVFFRHGNFLI